MGSDDFEHKNPEHRRYLRVVLSALPVPLLVLAEDFSIILINRAFRKAFGLDDSSIDPSTISQILPLDRLIDKIRGAQLRWNIEELDHRIKTSGGGEAIEEFTEASFEFEVNGRSHHFTLVPIRGLDDEAKLKTLVLVENLGPSELALDRERLGISSIVSTRTWQVDEGAPIALWQAEVETLAFTSVSPGVEPLLGYPASHWTESPEFFVARIFPDDRAAVLALYRAAIERGVDATAEFRSITASGGLRWCRETIRASVEDQIPLPLGGATLALRKSVFGVISDISRRKQLEEQLLRAERMQALQVLANKVAHDLNNPLMIIAGYAEEVRHALPEDHSMRAEVDQILTATHRISGLSSRLLELADGKAEAPQVIDVVRLIAGLEGRITTLVGESVALDLQLSQAEWAVAEPSQLEEVILAIASDRREDQGAYSRLAITCASEFLSEYVPQATLRAGAYTCITIRREGVLLDDLARASIFESFPGNTAGQALGRAYDIVRDWGGDIALTSNSLGSTFTVYLRRYIPESRESDVLEKVETPSNVDLSRTPAAEVERQTILLVDDEPLIRALILKILRREGYFVLEAASAEEALSIASRHLDPIDLLITDVILPGLSGRQLAEFMFSARPKLKIIYISGYTDDESVRRGSIPQGSRYLQKPFTLGALVGLVLAVLES